MKKTLVSMAIGAGLMYLLDPENGASRRAALRGQVNAKLPKTTDAVHHRADELSSKASKLTEKADEKAAEAIKTVSDVVDAKADEAIEAIKSVSHAIEAKLAGDDGKDAKSNGSKTAAAEKPDEKK